MQIRPRRSVLYMPGANARALEKAKTLAADGLILDLEDAVAPEAKETARRQVCDAVKAGGYGKRELIIRINGLDTPWGAADLAAAAAVGPDAILIPKPSTGADIVRATEAMASAGAPDKTRLWAMIETPLAILNLGEIGAVARSKGARLTCLVMGTNDLVKETRADLSEQPSAGAVLAVGDHHGRARLRPRRARRRLQQLQGRRRLPPRVRAWPRAGLRRQDADPPRSDRRRQRGVRTAADEVAFAKKIIAAFDLPESRGKGVITVEGRMVELMHAEMARRTVAIADAIAANA